MVVANADAEYVDIALRTKKLMFIATPHEEADLATWEEILDDLIRASGHRVKGRKSRVLPELALLVRDSMLNFDCALKYCIASPEETSFLVRICSFIAMGHPERKAHFD
jgi:hypothetical protein